MIPGSTAANDRDLSHQSSEPWRERVRKGRYGRWSDWLAAYGIWWRNTLGRRHYPELSLGGLDHLPAEYEGGSLELRDEDADKIWLADKRHNGRLTDQRLGAQGLGKLARRHHLITWVRLLWPGHDCDYR